MYQSMVLDAWGIAIKKDSYPFLRNLLTNKEDLSTPGV